MSINKVNTNSKDTKHSTNTKQNHNHSKQDSKNKQKAIGINARNDKAKYSDNEIAKKNHRDSIAKLLVRDRIHNDNIDTRNKWIDITHLKSNDKYDIYGNYAPEILSFDAEIFERKETPIYRNEMTEEKKHLLTFEVAEGDIEKQKKVEKLLHIKIIRPKYHVEVITRYTKDHKTEYQVKSIRQMS